MSLYNRILGHPFVYDRIRPFVVGGIDWSPLYRNLEAEADDVVLDVGCGTGVAHQYLKGFRAYHGFDTDAVAIAAAVEKTAGPNVHYECRVVTPEDVARIRPTRIVLAGILHHLSDDESLALLRMCGSVPTVKRIATSDVVYLPGTSSATSSRTSIAASSCASAPSFWRFPSGPGCASSGRRSFAATRPTAAPCTS